MRNPGALEQPHTGSARHVTHSAVPHRQSQGRSGLSAMVQRVFFRELLTMDSRHEPTPQWRRLLALALGLSFILMLVSFSRVALSYDFVLQGKALDSVVQGNMWGTKLGWDIARFVLGQLSLYCSFAALAVLLAWLSTLAWPRSGGRAKDWVLAWFLMLTVATFLANAHLFPWSLLGQYFGELVSSKFFGLPVALGIIGCIGALAAAVSIAGMVRLLARSTPRLRHGAAIVASGCALGAVAIPLLPSPQPHTPRDVRPHVIVIGVDSLRPDFTMVGGDDEHAPHVNELLRGSLAFSDVTTPLARTFPSWVTILTGRHPRETGAVVNLIERKRVTASPTLPEVLRSHGYQTIFAMDEVRFANIDASYGFDRVITPPAGAADFLLSTVNDTPLSNIVSRTWIGRLLFPHSHSNRGAAHVYSPEDFTARITTVDFDRPTFLAVHFTLPHYPFFWADAPVVQANGRAHTGRSQYKDTVKRVDRQVGALLQHLERRDVLKNAVVVFLSDHGEGFTGKGEPLIPRQHASLTNVQWWEAGHGTSVLNPHQYQVVLGFRAFGKATLPAVPRLINAPASLEDVAPTVLDLIDVEGAAAFSGRSLLSQLSAESYQTRIRFTETEFNPPALAAGFDAPQEIMRQSVGFYRVDDRTGLLSVRAERLAEILQGRQYAAIGKQHILAALPTSESGKSSYRFVLVRRDRAGEPKVVSGPADLETEPEAAMLWDALMRRFAGAIAHPAHSLELDARP